MNWNGAWYVICELPLGNKGRNSIQSISPWKYEKSSEQIINLKNPEMIVDIQPFKFTLLVRTLQYCQFIFARLYSTSVTYQEVLALSSTHSKYRYQLCSVLTNNLNMKVVHHRYVYVGWHTAVLKLWYFFWMLWKKSSFPNMFIFSPDESLYTRSSINP